MSRRKDDLLISQLEKTATHPAMTEVINMPAPMFAPTPISVMPPRTDMISENTSGAPFPKARNVTPAMLGGMLSFSTMESMTTQK